MKIQKTKNKLIIDNCDTFDLKDTLECGQIFSFASVKNNFIKKDYSLDSETSNLFAKKFLSFEIYSGNKFARASQIKNKIIIETQDVDYFFDFFDLANDYNKIKKELKKHKDFSKYLDFGSGIRILKQQPFQTLISFIVSANNNIKRIKKILESICKAYGTKTEFGYAFPTLNQLKNVTSADFLKLGAGYRSKYLEKTIKMLQNPEFDFETLKKLKTSKLRERLMRLSGVGLKVCDCIMLFGFSKLDVFPVDTWIRKSYYFFETKKRTDKQISQYFVNIFKENSGYAQQYLYNFMLNGFKHLEKVKVT